MDINGHKRLLAIIHIITGVLSITVIVFAMTIIRIFLPFLEDEIIRSEGSNAVMIMDLVGMFIRVISIILILFISLPSLVGGIATLNKQKWGMILLLISGCLSLLNFPFGTAKGAYTLWVYIEDNKQIRNVEN